MTTKRKANKKASGVFQVIRGGIVFELLPEPEGGYTITVPSLPGCISYGRTFEEAMEMSKDAMAGWLAVAREEGVPIPEQFEAIPLART
jgi:antitoxin HicB